MSLIAEKDHVYSKTPLTFETLPMDILRLICKAYFDAQNESLLWCSCISAKDHCGKHKGKEIFQKAIDTVKDINGKYQYCRYKSEVPAKPCYNIVCCRRNKFPCGYVGDVGLRYRGKVRQGRGLQNLKFSKDIRGPLALFLSCSRM